jgi:hypothetical protein
VRAGGRVEPVAHLFECGVDQFQQHRRIAALAGRSVCIDFPLFIVAQLFGAACESRCVGCH